jgi:hypothetical protein
VFGQSSVLGSRSAQVSASFRQRRANRLRRGCQSDAWPASSRSCSISSSPGSLAATLRHWPPPKQSAGPSAVDVRPANVEEMRGSASWKRDQPPVDGLGLPSWSCHLSAHPVEQNGSPFLTSGRSPAQHKSVHLGVRTDQLESAAGCPTKKKLSLAIVDRAVMPHLAGVSLTRTQVPGPAAESCSPWLHRLARVKRVGRLRALAGVLATGPV